MRDPELLREAADLKRKEAKENPPSCESKIHFDFLPDWSERSKAIDQLATKHNGKLWDSGAGAGQRHMEFDFLSKKDKDAFENAVGRDFPWATIVGD